MYPSILLVSVAITSIFSQLASSQFTVPLIANTSGPTGPVVDLGYIQLQGTSLVSTPFPVNAWLGVRYAAPPTSDLRFKAAVSIEGSTSSKPLFDATTYGPYCYQGFVTWGPPPSVVLSISNLGNRQPSEDCLLLDIYAPAEPASSKLPVLLYIHGGGYDGGSSTQLPFAGIMSAAPGQFIVVNIQYRLAGFGFLGGAEVQETGKLNAGLLDQRFAMQWVQRHIAAFGGDPDKVTIDGGSAGGGSVSYQLVWNGGEDQPPYRAAIAEYPWWPTVLNSSQLEKQYRQVLSAANCSDITCLRSLSSEDFDDAQQQVLSTSNSYPYGLSYFGPTVDGDYIRDLPTKELQAGHFAKVPLITTRDGNEGALFTPQNITTDEAFQTRIRAMLNGGESFFGHLNDYYPSDVTGPFDYNSTQQKANYVMGDWIIHCPTYYLASAFTDALSIINPSSQQVYKFIYALPTFNTATHGAYFNLVFPITGVLANDTSPTAELTRTLQGYYTSFIIDLEPNSGAVSVNSSVVWPQYGSSSQILLINDTIPVQIKDVDASGRCDFYYSHPYNVQN